jgi:hypothetical protein
MTVFFLRFHADCAANLELLVVFDSTNVASSAPITAVASVVKASGDSIRAGEQNTRLSGDLRFDFEVPQSNLFQTGYLGDRGELTFEVAFALPAVTAQLAYDLTVASRQWLRGTPGCSIRARPAI